MSDYYIVGELDKGPYTYSELEHLFAKGDISISTLIKAAQTSKVESLRELIDNKLAPPSVPDISVKAGEWKKLKNKLMTVDIKGIATPFLNIKTNLFNKNNEKSSNTKVIIIISIGIVLAGLGIFGSIEYKQFYFPEIKNTMGLKKRDFQRFQDIALRSLHKTIIYFSFDKQRQKLWGVTNYPLSGEIQLNFSSIDKQILNSTPVKFSAKGTIHKRVIEVDKFEFERGDKFIPGYYRVDAEVFEVHNPTVLLKYFKKPNLKFSVNEVFLLGAGSKKLFERQLQKYIKKNEFSNQAFVGDIIEKYKTLLVVVEQIEAVFFKHISNKEKSWTQNMMGLEKEYTKSQGVFFTNFVIENNRKFKKTTLASPQSQELFVTLYRKLNSSAKSLGWEVMEFLEQLTSYNQKPDQKNQKHLEEKIRSKFEIYKNIFNAQIDQLSKDQ